MPLQQCLRFLRRRHDHHALAGALLCGAALVAQAQPLSIERLPLGEGPSEQVYNFQEQGDWRLWARSAAGFKGSRIWLQRRDQGSSGSWAAPQPAPFSDPRYRDSDPFLTADGKRLLFISDRPAEPGGPATGQLDLFESRHAGDDGWQAPRRLAEGLQSPAYELGPELHGGQLWFASQRPGGPGKLSIYRAALEPDRAGRAEALPAPVNTAGGLDSDPTLSPDGRYLLWWSGRSGRGDLYLAERVGPGFGPALRLPAPINSDEGFEFTPWISADGAWLYFASTRADEGAQPGPQQQPDGLSRVYRTSWPALLQALGPAARAHSQAALDAAVSRFWRALSHPAGQGSDTAALAALLHPEARLWGLLLRERQALPEPPQPFAAVLAAWGRPDPRPMQECELAREQRRYGALAWVYSRVRTDREPGSPPYTGINSMQWQLGPQGWRLLSLHYALDLPGEPLPAEGGCLP